MNYVEMILSNGERWRINLEDLSKLYAQKKSKTIEEEKDNYNFVYWNDLVLSTFVWELNYGELKQVGWLMDWHKVLPDSKSLFGCTTEVVRAGV